MPENDAFPRTFQNMAFVRQRRLARWEDFCVLGWRTIVRRRKWNGCSERSGRL